jgi:hypothetical protein
LKWQPPIRACLHVPSPGREECSTSAPRRPAASHRRAAALRSKPVPRLGGCVSRSGRIPFRVLCEGRGMCSGYQPVLDPNQLCFDEGRQRSETSMPQRLSLDNSCVSVDSLVGGSNRWPEASTRRRISRPLSYTLRPTAGESRHLDRARMHGEPCTVRTETRIADAASSASPAYGAHRVIRAITRSSCGE